ncbi:MAG: hypothetical protein FJ347_07850 [Sphingomonadales bacterium]|nr:hypothetical protein [Sphingomonadales bacterium]
MKIFITLTFALLLAACSVTRQTRTQKSAKYLEVNQPGVYSIPLVADLKVTEEKAAGKSSGRLTPGAPDNTPVVEGVKVQAVADALKKSKADVLVEPNFTIEVDGLDVNVAVTGYPAVYKNFRNYTVADSMALKLRSLNKIEKATGANTNQVTEKKKTKLGWIIGGAVVLIIIIASGGA